jgi:hypothetical protein
MKPLCFTAWIVAGQPTPGRSRLFVGQSAVAVAFFHGTQVV